MMAASASRSACDTRSLRAFLSMTRSSLRWKCDCRIAAAACAAVTAASRQSVRGSRVVCIEVNQAETGLCLSRTHCRGDAVGRLRSITIVYATLPTASRAAGVIIVFAAATAMTVLFLRRDYRHEREIAERVRLPDVA